MNWALPPTDERPAMFPIDMATQARRALQSAPACHRMGEINERELAYVMGRAQQVIDETDALESLFNGDHQPASP